MTIEIFERTADAVAMPDESRPVRRGILRGPGSATPGPEWKEVLAVAGVRDARVHDGRHTTGTLLIESGVPLRVVMQLLGHSQMRMTERYTHVAGPVAADAAAKLSDALWLPEAQVADPN